MVKYVSFIVMKKQNIKKYYKKWHEFYQKSYILFF